MTKKWLQYMELDWSNDVSYFKMSHMYDEVASCYIPLIFKKQDYKAAIVLSSLEFLLNF